MEASVFSNLTILDFTRYLPGGYATQPFADWGANVIKVEDTGGGDYCRHDYPTINEISYYITALGRNKKSISVDLKDSEVVELFLNIARKADVIIESFRPGVTKRLGIDYESIKSINPGIIYASISGYGQEDPTSLKPLHDINMQAQTGYLSVNHGDSSPIHLCDLSAGMTACQAILAALLVRQQTGEGSYIDVSMFDSFVWWNSLIDSRWAFNGGICKKNDLEYPSVAFTVYDTADGGRLALGLVEEKFWSPFCEELGMPELKGLGLKRRWEAPEAFERVAEVVRSKTTAEWQQWIDEHDYCIALAPTKDEAIPSIVANRPNTLNWVEFPDVGRVLQTNIPHHVSTLPVSISDFKPAARLGQNTQEVLEWAGATDGQINELARRGAVKLDTPAPNTFNDDNPIAPY